MTIRLGLKTAEDFLKSYTKQKNGRYRLVTNYISIYVSEVIIIDARRTKIKTKVNTNYRSAYQYTTYFLDNKEVISDSNNSREEYSYWIKN